MAELVADLKINTTQFQQGVEKAIRDSKELSTTLQNVAKGDTFTKASSGINTVDKSLDNATASAKQLAKQLDNVAREAQSAGSKAKQGLGSFADALTGGLVGGGVAVLGSQLASLASGALTAVIEKGSQFEQTLSAVGAIVGQSGKPLDELGEKARELGVKFGTDATDQLSAFQTILSKVGPQVAESAPALQKFTDAANILGKAGGIDAATATNNLVDAMLQLGLVTGDANKDAENAVFLTNQLAKSAQVGAAEIPQVAQSLLQVGASSKLLNQSTDATIAAIQALALGGKTGSEAGVAYRNVLGLMVKASGEGDKAFARLGTNTQELGKLLTDNKSPTEALRKLKTGLQGVSSESERAALLSKIFGAENSAAAAILIENVDKISEFQTGIQDAQKGTGSAFEQAKQQMETFQQVAKTAQATLSDIAISAFQEFQKVIGSLFTGGDAIDFGGIAKKAKEIIGVIGEIAKPLLQVLKATFAFSQLISQTVLQSIINISKNFAEAFGTFETTGASAFDVLKSVVNAFVDSIVVFVDIVSTYIGLLGTVWGSVFGSILGNYSEGEKGTQSFGDKVKAFAESASASMKSFATFVTNAINSIKPTLSDIGNLIGTLAKYIGTVLKGAFDLIVGSITATVNVFKFFGSVITSTISIVSGFVTSLFGASKQTTSTGTAVKSTGGFFTDLGKKVNEAGGFINYFTAILNGASSVISNFAGNVSEAFKLLSSGEFSKGFDALYNSVFNSANAFTQGFNKSLDESKKRTEQFAKEKEQQAKETAKTEVKVVQEAEKQKGQETVKGAKGSTKTVESELKKQQKLYEEANAKLTNTDSEYYKAVQALQNNQTLTESQKAQQRLKLDQDLNNKRKELLRSIFKLEGDNINNLSTKITLTKDDDFNTIKGYFEKELIETDKLNADALKIKADRLKREQELNKKFFESFVTDTKDAFENANELLNLKVDEAITSTALIEQLQALGIEVEFGAKLNADQLKAIGNASKEQLETILSDIQLAEQLVKDDPKQAKALKEFRFKVEDALKGIRPTIAVEPKGIETTFIDAFSKLGAGLGALDFKIDTSKSEEALKNVQKSITEIDKALAKGEITGEEYQTRLNELNQQQAEALANAPTALEQALQQVSKVFMDVNTAILQTATLTGQQLLKISTDLQALPKNSEAYTTKLAEQTAKQNELYGQLGASLATVIGGALTDQEDKGKAFLRGLFDLASKAVSILLPVILAQYSAFEGPIGTAVAGFLTASIVGALNLIKGTLGFEKGGLVPGGEKMVRINEAGQEFVINANATKRNMGVLEALNSGNDRRAFELLADRYNGGTAVSSNRELVAIKEELAMLRQERVLSRTRVEMSDVTITARGNDLSGVIRSNNQFRNVRR